MQPAEPFLCRPARRSGVPNRQTAIAASVVKQTMMQPSSRYFLCDQSLRSFSGHCYAYLQPLRRVLQERGKEVVMVGYHIVDPPVAERDVIACFTYWCDERHVGQRTDLDSEANADAIREAHERAILGDLRQLHRRFNFRAGDRLILNSVRQWQIRGVIKWLESLPEKECPETALLLHFTGQPEPFCYDPALRLNREAFEWIEGSPRGHRLHLYADATTLIDEYREMTALEVALAPFPHSCLHDPTLADRRPGRPLRVGYVGEARINKGFHLLPFVAESLSRSDLADTVEFHIHSFIFYPQQPFYHQAMAHLRPLSNVTLYPDILDPAEYEAFVNRCDVILVPYLLSYYHRQTSGIYADAVGTGVPVVVSRGTWNATELKRLGGGLAAIPDDYMSLAEATYRVCADIDRYRKEADCARERWQAFNTPENMIDMFEAW